MQNKVDILFVLDNSAGMAGMLTELKNHFADLLSPLEQVALQGYPIDLQIGVTTTDYGAGATGAPGCDISPGGQQGKLQAVGKYADMSCVKPTGSNYIKDVLIADQHTGTIFDGMNNLPKDGTGKVTQDLVTTFSCMASVGANGCGYIHPLEAVYAALHNGLRENQGFVRSDALLVVLFFTNGDDGSAPPSTDLFDKSKPDRYGFEDRYRQTRFGIICCPPGMTSCDPSQLQLPPYGSSMGPLAQCQAAPNPDATVGPQGGREYDVSRYIDFFQKPINQGGIKVNPLDVMVLALDAPDSPVEVILSNPGTADGQPYVECPVLEETSNPPCAPVVQHSCQNPAQSDLWGDPPVRLNTVVRSVLNHDVASICADDYGSALTRFGNEVASRLFGNCIPDRLPKDAKGAPIANGTVRYDLVHRDGTVDVVSLPQCPKGAGGYLSDSENSAGPNLFPCWKAETEPFCLGTSPDEMALRIDQTGASLPADSWLELACESAHP